LGDEQSGHIKEVGYELYQSMLEEAIMDAKAGGLRDRPRDFSPQITVDAPILIPEDYVPDLDLRMGLYRRLNELEASQEIEAFAAELIDRFGPLPDATDNLIRVIEIKLNARKACIAKMDVGAKGVLVSFHDNKPANIDALLAYVDRLKDVAKLRPDGKLVLNRAWPDAKARLHGALQLSKGLAKTAG
jgi:transcription-repair coupling factor (superfamily II helicase)